MLWTSSLIDSSTCVTVIRVKYDEIDNGGGGGVDKLLSKVEKPQKTKKSQKLLVKRNIDQNTNLLSI